MSISAPIDFETLENTIHTWFVWSTDLETIWNYQGAPQAEYPFATLSIISGPTEISPHWIDRYETDLTRDAGYEIKMEKGVPCTMTVSCHVFVVQPDARNPEYNSRAYMLKALAGLRDEKTRGEFADAQISLIGAESMSAPNEVIGETYVSRAAMDVRFNCVLNHVSYAGYIERVNMVSTELGIDQDFGVLS